jgi:LuxR family maltose regulon positive regulatory protein
LLLLPILLAEQKMYVETGLVGSDMATIHFLVKNLPLWLSGEGRTIQNWVLALPDIVLSAHTRLALNAALRLINSINLSNETQYASLQAQMERTFTRMEGILHRKRELALSEAEVAVIERRLRLLRALIEARALLKHGDKERLQLLSQEIEALPQDEEVNWSIIPLTLIF